MALSLSEILTAKLEQLGGKTAYWLALEIGYEPKNIYKILNGQRALPEEYLPKLMRTLGISADGDEAKELETALAIARAKLKDDIAPTVDKMQRDVLRLTQALERMNRVVDRQRGELAILREQRETASSKVRELESKIIDQAREVVELGKVITRLEKLETERRAERNQR